MQICEKHWMALKTAVSKRGLDHLIAPDGHAVVEMMKRQSEGTASALDFDPLMNAHNQLVDVAMGFVGAINLIASDSCPVCVLEGYDWCDGAAHQSLIYAEKNGLMLPKELKG
jgi:hypothetical protein